MRPTMLDRLVTYRDPERGLRRLKARAQLEGIQQYLSVNERTGNGEGYGAHGASKKKKSFLGWRTFFGSADKDITENKRPLTERSRDLFMGSGLAAGALKTIRTNVVGSGLRLNAAIDFDFLGLSSEAAGKWEANTEREFRLWADSVACDAYRRMTFGQIQSLALLEMLHSGDAFAALPVLNRPGEVYGLHIRLITGDRVCTPTNGAHGTADVLGGIELDDQGAPVAAWIAKHHPAAKSLPNEWTRVGFYSAQGFPQLLHIYQDFERIGQRRGVPLLAPVIEELKQLSRYTEGELMNCVVNAFATVFVTSDTPQSPLGGPSSYAGDDEPAADDGGGTIELGMGSVVSLPQGDKAEMLTTGRNNVAFAAFVEAICHYIGAGIELPRELLVKHFTSSYSASRAALQEAWKMFSMRRTWLVDSFVQPIYEQWLAEAVAMGRIQAPGFFTDPAVRAAWCGAEWVGPSQGHLNPLVEARAAQIRIEEEISTREREAAEATGMIWEDIHAVRTREEAARRQDRTIKKPGEWNTAEEIQRDQEAANALLAD